MKKYLIAGGNPTLLVWDIKPWEKQKIINKYLKKNIDQIGFIENEKLQMMGGELCINALLAFKYITKLKANFTISLEFKKKKNIILLNGIGFIFLKNDKQIDIPNLAKKYNLPAFGKVIYKGNKITPYIFVKATNSLKQETACGSASVALNILKGYRKIIQPTGDSIFIKKINNNFTISAKVEEVKL